MSACNLDESATDESGNTDSFFPGSSFTASTCDNTDNVVSWLLHRHRAQIETGHQQILMTPLVQAQVELLSQLERAHAPMYLAKDIWEWARKWSLRDVDFSNSCNRKTVLKNLKERYGHKDICEPKIETTLLPALQEPATVVRFDFLEQVYSLLSDTELMKDDNLLFRDNSPFTPPPHNISPTEHLSDINDGKLYKDAYKKYILNPQREVLCPLILFIDKTFVDQKSRLTLEPLAFTLGIFDKFTRRKHYAWRSLGYVINFRGLNHESPDDKCRDYHHLLSAMLQSLKDAQQTNGIAWTMKYKGNTYNVVFKIPILCILGDTLGHDDLCCHKTSKRKINFLCRYCNCPKVACGTPVWWSDNTFSYTRESQIRKILQRGDVVQLNFFPTVLFTMVCGVLSTVMR